LRQADTAGKASDKLRALWQVLIPPPQRKALTDGTVRRLLVVPDGHLALLPLETLVVAAGRAQQTLLDVGPPLLYGPSATVLYNLARRPVETAGGRGAVLTVGDPRYASEPTREIPRPSPTDLSVVSPATRYAAVGGRLSRLPYTGWESSWVAEVFQKQGMPVSRLQGEKATEANVREHLSGRRVVHLACHGLADQSHGNFFGALALAPGPRAGTEMSDDGFLTLAEIYPLNLGYCELVILSACETNFGPQQYGEGVWALSRGFLVAGARRVVATGWLVDDEAAASLISVFCTYLARAEKEGTPLDHAAALQRAKRWVRQQEKWSSPYYWGTFVLVGPN
jgi:CHAT domain-containing protein